MLVQGAMIVWAMAATALPLGDAHAAEATPGVETAAVEAVHPDAALAPASLPAEPVQNVSLDSRPAGLVYKLETPANDTRSDNLRFDLAGHPAPELGRRLSPAASSPRMGWAISGRAGPLRWLTPLVGEGETTLRLGRRLPDQPRIPGLGRFSVSVHYSFE